MAASALKKITAEAKRIRKSKPKTSWKSAVKQAGAKFRAGKLKPKRKAAPKKRVVKKKAVASPKAVRRKRVVKKKTLPRGKGVKARRYKAATYSRGKYRPGRRISGTGGRILGMKPKTLALVAGGLGLLYVLSKKKVTA